MNLAFIIFKEAASVKTDKNLKTPKRKPAVRKVLIILIKVNSVKINANNTISYHV